AWDRDGDGALRERTQRGAGKCAGFFDPWGRSVAAAFGQRLAAQRAEYSGSAGCSITDAAGGNLYVGTLARLASLGAARLFGGFHNQPGKKRSGRIHLRTGLPARRV